MKNTGFALCFSEEKQTKKTWFFASEKYNLNTHKDKKPRSFDYGFLYIGYTRVLTFLWYSLELAQWLALRVFLSKEL